MALLSNVIGRGVVASRPAAGSAGALYYATDVGGGGQLQRDNGTTWDSVEGTGGGGAVTLTYATNALGSNTAVGTSLTSGPALAGLAAGTWRVIAQVTFIDSVGGRNVEFAINNGTTNLFSGEVTMVSGGGYACQVLSFVLVLSGTTTLTFQAKACGGGVGEQMLASTSSGLPNASIMSAEKIG